MYGFFYFRAMKPNRPFGAGADLRNLQCYQKSLVPEATD